jgi:oligoribonuclease (3'-5' exoribonuclease)
MIIASKDTSKTKKEKIIANIIEEHRLKILNKIFKKIIHQPQVGFVPGMQGWYNIHKSINVIQHITESRTKTTSSYQ